MEIAETRRPDRLDAFLAGLQAGMVGALLSAAWMALGSAAQGRGFSGASKLLATVFYGANAIRPGLRFSVIAGLALYILIYASLGGLFALLLPQPPRRFRLALAGILFGVTWYYASYWLIWPRLAPVMSRLNVPSFTVLGHLIYGAALARFPAYRDAAPCNVETAPPAEDAPQAEQIAGGGPGNPSASS